MIKASFALAIAYTQEGYINRAYTTTNKSAIPPNNVLPIDNSVISKREKNYILIHRRFGYMGQSTIKNLYYVITHPAI